MTRIHLHRLVVDDDEGCVLRGQQAIKVELAAQRVAYADPANFACALRKWTGVIPSAFRARLKAQRIYLGLRSPGPASGVTSRAARASPHSEQLSTGVVR